MCATHVVWTDIDQREKKVGLIANDFYNEQYSFAIGSVVIAVDDGYYSKNVVAAATAVPPSVAC